jgi:hypothetical protein
MNRSRYKATSGDMRTIGTGIESYKIDNFGRSVTAQANPEDIGVTLAGYLANMDYLENPPLVDGWGMPILYCNRAGNVQMYGLGSGGSNGPATAGGLKAKGDLVTDPVTRANFGDRTNRRWECDIAFADGQFFFGDCNADGTAG